MPAGAPGRGKKTDGQTVGFNRSTVAAYRKLATNAARLDEYYAANEDVPTQTDFIRYCGSDGAETTEQMEPLTEATR